MVPPSNFDTNVLPSTNKILAVEGNFINCSLMDPLALCFLCFEPQVTEIISPLSVVCPWVCYHMQQRYLRHLFWWMRYTRSSLLYFLWLKFKCYLLPQKEWTTNQGWIFLAQSKNAIWSYVTSEEGDDTHEQNWCRYTLSGRAGAGTPVGHQAKKVKSKYWLQMSWTCPKLDQMGKLDS